MRIREFKPEDAETIHAIQKRYPEMWEGLPQRDVHVDFDAPDIFLTLIAEEDDGTFIAALGALHRYEIWATMDRNGRPPQDYVWVLRKLIARLIVELFKRGVPAGFCSVPPKLKSWSNMLAKRFGFEKIVGPDFFWFNAQKMIEHVKKLELP